MSYKIVGKSCSVPGCLRPARWGDLCYDHYRLERVGK